MKIAIEGYRFVLVAVGLAVLGFLLGWILIGFLGVALGVFLTWFFRDPERHTPEAAGLVVAPADGKVVSIVRIDNGPFPEGAKTRVSIFMSPFDVHINRMPVKGVVEEVHHRPGMFFAAYKDEAVEQNEQNAMLIGEAGGRKLGVVQVAGFLARRVVCKARKGDNLERGERFGLIMFGSRTDLYLPLDAEVAVKEGDKVKGGETVIGRLV
ncbi:MAG: phosphatidylserine decarboxylase family protein [Deltaproteobacteria bacterium]|nr:phosphatidylserine decarboxylase family protein [Deltaproteobacteria bacterium]